MPDVLPAMATNRRQTTYRDSHSAKIDFSMPQPEYETSMSYNNNLAGNVAVEVDNSEL